MLPSRTLAHVQRRRRWTATLAVALLFSLAALPGRVNAQTAPDLIIRGLSLSTSVVREGDVVTAVVTVWNYGRGPANPFSIGLHVAARRDAPVDGTTELGRLAVGTLAAGASAQRSLTFKVPAVAPGTFYVIAQADVAEVVAETSDRNNRRSAALYVVLPDLVVDSLTVTPNTAAAGDTVTVRARVRNLGRVSANATEGALHFAT
jgi:subtilase family serine protease